MTRAFDTLVDHVTGNTKTKINGNILMTPGIVFFIFPSLEICYITLQKQTLKGETNKI